MAKWLSLHRHGSWIAPPRCTAFCLQIASLCGQCLAVCAGVCVLVMCLLPPHPFKEKQWWWWHVLMAICQAVSVPEESSAISQTRLFVTVLLGTGWGPCGSIWKSKSGLWWEDLRYVERCSFRQSSKLVWLYPGPETQDTRSLIHELWFKAAFVCPWDSDPCCRTGKWADSVLWWCHRFWVSFFVFYLSHQVHQSHCPTSTAYRYMNKNETKTKKSWHDAKYLMEK